MYGHVFEDVYADVVVESYDILVVINDVLGKHKTTGRNIYIYMSILIVYTK